MKKLVEAFPRQLHEALEIGAKASLRAGTNPIHNILITGLGGSGIGGTILADIVSPLCAIPLLVSKDYHIPGFVNENTLVIVSSYSGNTEETLAAMNEAISRKAKVVCVSSGGKVSEIASANKLDIITIPGGMPPRACLAYSLTQLFYILSFHKFISSDFIQEIKEAILLIDTQSTSIQKEATAVADTLFGKIPVLYSVNGNEGITIRFRQQINENSKMLCWHHVIPEMNHNELVGWRKKSEDWAVIILRNKDDFAKNQTRIEINKEVISKYAGSITEIWSKGNSRIERALYLIHLCDWVSVILAEKQSVDPIEINVINYLKSELGK